MVSIPGFPKPFLWKRKSISIPRRFPVFLSTAFPDASVFLCVSSVPRRLHVSVCLQCFQKSPCSCLQRYQCTSLCSCNPVSSLQSVSVLPAVPYRVPVQGCLQSVPALPVFLCVPAVIPGSDCFLHILYLGCHHGPHTISRGGPKTPPYGLFP
ncbi:hypothetical protein GDO81_013401 [Engystomops pustulosus]|uniref:Uncharacterized protein n=1 Tax=Engystomops pustulosus TaxID=76066 RepID=A0AAV7B1H0_ENGPU|nr:hypothetical protein GDO81_013401 [Engystomops pustulosus]